MRALARRQFGVRASEQKVGVKSSDERPKCLNSYGFAVIAKVS